MAAAATCDAAVALGAEKTITFVIAPLGLFSSLAPAFVVNLTGTNANGIDQSIINDPTF
jgi:hypothetical protein